MRRRSIYVVLAVAMLLGSIAAAADARKPAYANGATTIVSNGSGRQVLEGGGLTYGTIAAGSVSELRVWDYSSKHDAKVTVTAQASGSSGSSAGRPVKASRLSGGQLFRLKPTRQNASRTLAFSVSGSHFRLVLDGTSSLNGAGVTGRITLYGDGTITINGQDPPLDWETAGRIQLAPKGIAAAKAAAAATATRTTTTSATTTTGTP
jgi:hypothetical protein